MVVTSHKESEQGFFTQKQTFSSVQYARAHAYKANLGRWKGTVYTEQDPPPGFKTELKTSPNS